MFFPRDSDQKSGLKPVIPGEGHNCNDQLQHQGKKYRARRTQSFGLLNFLLCCSFKAGKAAETEEK